MLSYCYHISGYTRLQLSNLDEHGIHAIKTDSFKKKNAFIISSVPQSNDIFDVWELFNKHYITAIVLLNKLDPLQYYWPTKSKKTIRKGSTNVKLLLESSEEYEGITIRNIQFENQEKSSTIKQYHLTCWEDDKEVIDAKVMKALFELTRHLNGSILLQCTTGVERSGMFLALHNTLEMLEASQPIDIACTVKRLRLSNQGFVATFVQYSAVHNWFVKKENCRDYYNVVGDM